MWVPPEAGTFRLGGGACLKPRALSDISAICFFPVSVSLPRRLTSFSLDSSIRLAALFFLGWYTS